MYHFFVTRVCRITIYCYCIQSLVVSREKLRENDSAFPALVASSNRPLLQPGSQDTLHGRPRFDALPDAEASTLQSFQDALPHGLVYRRPTHARRAYGTIQHAPRRKRDRQTDRACHSGHPRVAIRSKRRRVHLFRAAVPVARYDLVVQEDEIALVRRVPECVSEVLHEGVRRCDGPTWNGLFRHRGG